MAIKPVNPISAPVEPTQTTPKAKVKRSQLSVTLPQEMIERVKEYRFVERKDSISAVILEALEAYLPKTTK